MPYPTPLRFPVSTQEYDAVAVLEGDLMARQATLAADRPLLKAIARSLIGHASPLWKAQPSLWLVPSGAGSTELQVVATAPIERFGEAFAQHTSRHQLAGRDVVVTTVDDAAFRAAIPPGAFRFDDLFHLHMEYFEGHCHHFALAAKLVTGCPLGIMWDDLEFVDKEQGIKEMAHVFLQLPDGRAFDYDGLRTVPELQAAIAGRYAHQTSCGALKVSDLKDFIENGWLDDYNDENLLQALDLIALDPVLFQGIESIAPGKLAEVRSAIAADLGFEPEGPRPWSALDDPFTATDLGLAR